MNIWEFANKAYDPTGNFFFGMGTGEDVAKALEGMAQKIREDKYLVQRVEFYDAVDQEDYTLRTFAIKFAERHPLEEPPA